jgi:hypothetical protein
MATYPAKMVVMWVVDAAEGVPWREVRYEGQPAWLVIRLKFAPTADGVAVAGAQIERRDGRALTARDLRLVKLPPNWFLFGESASRWFAPADAAAPVAATKKGAHGHDDDHWRAIHSAWLQAMESAPRAPVKWLLASGRWPVTDATMRRWIARARQRAAELGWDQDGPAQKGTHFLRQHDERPVSEPGEEGPAPGEFLR